MLRLLISVDDSQVLWLFIESRGQSDFKFNQLLINILTYWKATQQRCPGILNDFDAIVQLIMAK